VEFVDRLYCGDRREDISAMTPIAPAFCPP
jgi:hypothetical protein